MERGGRKLLLEQESWSDGWISVNDDYAHRLDLYSKRLWPSLVKGFEFHTAHILYTRFYHRDPYAFEIIVTFKKSPSSGIAPHTFIKEDVLGILSCGIHDEARKSALPSWPLLQKQCLTEPVASGQYFTCPWNWRWALLSSIISSTSWIYIGQLTFSLLLVMLMRPLWTLLVLSLKKPQRRDMFLAQSSIILLALERKKEEKKPQQESNFKRAKL
jgi:hypothetical protein